MFKSEKGRERELTHMIRMFEYSSLAERSDNVHYVDQLDINTRICDGRSPTEG